MKTTIVLMALFLIATSAHSYSVVTIEGRASKPDDENVEYRVNTDLHLYYTSSITSKLSIFGFSLTGKNYSEAYAGVGVTPIPGITLSIGSGIETSEKSPWRVATSLYIGKDEWPFSLYACYEDGGGSGSFYKGTVTYNFTEWFTAGIWVKRFAGIGPYFQVNHPIMPIKLYVVPMHDSEYNTQNIVVGIKLDI